MACVRQAWLELNGRVLPLEDQDAGYICTQLDLGYPVPREVMDDRPDHDGVDDRTSLMGSRVVQVVVLAMESRGARVDEVASRFAPFMVPSVRPVLHYILDRDDNPERVLTLRASGYAWPITGPESRETQMQWVAGDPIAYGVDEHSTEARPGLPVPPGRTYDLTFSRVYPPGGGNQTTGLITTDGDVPAQPMLRVYGPVTQPQVNVDVTLSDGTTIVQRVWFQPTFRIASHEFVDIDTVHRTAYIMGNVLRPALRYLEWVNVRWPVVAPGASGRVSLVGYTTGDSTLVVATWRDGYIS